MDMSSQLQSLVHLCPLVYYIYYISVDPTLIKWSKISEIEHFGDEIFGADGN